MPTPTPTPDPTPNTALIKVAYIGGSITQGSFSSVPEKSYSGLFTSWLATRYSRVEARNLGFSGTGSEFAVYRLDHDLDGFAPDLALIEFTVNDAGNTRPQIFAHVDAIAYKLRQLNPRVKIVYVSSTDLAEEADRRLGHRASYVEDSAAVAAFESIPFIDMAAGMWTKILAGTPASTFMADNVHPKDAGHQLYFEAIRDALDKSLPLAVQPSITTSRLIEQSKLQTAKLVAGSAATGCRGVKSTVPYLDSALTCDRGESFTYRFSGTTVGVIRSMLRTGGRLACTIDGGSPIQVDFYDGIVPTWERPFPLFLYRGLTAGEHVLACQVTDDLISVPEGTSTGRQATIGYFMVGDEQPVTLP